MIIITTSAQPVTCPITSQ